MKKALLYLLTVYISVPVFLYLFPWIMSYAIFSHLLRFPYSADLSRPQDVLNHTCNFYLNTEEDVSVGVWYAICGHCSAPVFANAACLFDTGGCRVKGATVIHLHRTYSKSRHTLPVSQWEASAGRTLDWYHETLGDGSPVIIYLHGNVGTRAMSHRVGLVKVLSAAGYHVLSLDYRGFGDSTGEPSEAGLTSDALYLYQWVKTRSRSLVCFWGHSLGSGVATNAAVKLQQQGSAVDALILEAPYTKIGEAVALHPIAKMYAFLPGFESLLWHLLERISIQFANDENLKKLTSPLLILHSEDDRVVPLHMGQKLHQISLQAHRESDTDAQVEMISYSAHLGFSHSSIYLDPHLPDVVQKFFKNVRR